MMKLPRHMKKYPNKFVIMTFYMSVLMTELPKKLRTRIIYSSDAWADNGPFRDLLTSTDYSRTYVNITV